MRVDAARDGTTEIDGNRVADEPPENLEAHFAVIRHERVVAWKALEDRCFPKTRDHAKEILRELGVPFYDPLLIIEKTKGRMEGDHQWILILKKEECR